MRPVKFQYPGVPSSKAPISRCRGNCPLPNRKRITAGRRPGLPATYFPHLPADSDERINCADRIAKAWTEAGDFEAAAAWIQSLPRDTARDFATAALAESIHATDPQASRAWAVEIQSWTIRAGVLKKLGQ